MRNPITGQRAVDVPGDTLGDLINALVDAGVDPTDGDNPDMEAMRLFVVEQPSYPLVTTVDTIEVRKGKVFLHLANATEYYGSEEEEEEEEEEE